ncbi:MAG: tRNA lysidine(34) synthetase TilS [Thermoanaerobaculia bacterium]
MLDTLQAFLQRHAIDGRLLVAVSGGFDSTALLLALRELPYPSLVAGHVHHHLRGAQSDEDEQFVRKLCADQGIELLVADGTLDPQAVREGGIEAAAREVRQARLLEMREVIGARFVATAHQRNDQAETVLMRLLTGGGLGALRGIHPIRDDGIIRPLLEVSRAEVERFLSDRGVQARFDQSNDDLRFLRNRIRATLRTLDSQAIDSLVALGQEAATQWPAMQQILDQVEDADVLPDATRFRTLPEDLGLRQALLHRHIRRLDPHSRTSTAAGLQRLARSLDRLRRVSVTRSLELVREDGAIVLRQRAQGTEPFEVAISAGERLSLPPLNATISLRRCDADDGPLCGPGPRQRFQLPVGSTPLFVVRNRRNGDRFQPLGLSHEKKLKELLIDRKIAVRSRDRIPLLLWNDTIVWVGGVEVSERFKIAETEADRYEVSIEENEEGIQR